MSMFPIGRVVSGWLNFEPPTHGQSLEPCSEEDALRLVSIKISRPPSPTCSEGRGLLLDPSTRRRNGRLYNWSLTFSLSSLSEDEGGSDNLHPCAAL